VLGTEQAAARLATLHGADVEKARRAALLHDCTKRLGAQEQLALCRHYGIEADEIELAFYKLLHAKTGAALARDVFGADEEIVGAIRWHTTGRPNMTLLEKVIYMADYIEDSRAFEGVDALRRLCQTDLDAALLLGFRLSVEDTQGRGSAVHHHTLDAKRFLEERPNG
jgi:nicotinate-nucleotide adenylyltransferase